MNLSSIAITEPDSLRGHARNLGLEVVAEGIETALQLDLLKTMGCAQGQGFYLSEAGG